MESDHRDIVFSVESPDLEEDGGGGIGGETESDEDLNSPLISTTTKSVTVALPAASTVPIAAIPVDSSPKWHRITEIVHQKPPMDDSRRLFQRLWTDEDEIELLRGFLDYVTNHHRGGNNSHPPETAPFYEQIKSKLRFDFNKNQLVEKLRRLKKKYRNVMSKIGSGKEVLFKSVHDQESFEISKKIWNQSGKIIGFEDDFEETNIINGSSSFNITQPNIEIDSEEKKVTMSSKKRSRSRIMKIDEDKPITTPCDEQIPNENVTSIDGNNLSGLIEETVRNCVSPLIKEMMNGTKGMMMDAMGGHGHGHGHGLGGLSSMLIPSMNLGFGGKGGDDDERWRRQQILELEVYSRRLELVQEQIRERVNELKTMPNGG